MCLRGRSIGVGLPAYGIGSVFHLYPKRGLPGASNMKSILPLLITSLLVALFGFPNPLSRYIWPEDLLWLIYLGPAAVWSILFAGGLVRYGRRGLWVLIGAPFALFFPLFWSYLYLFCVIGIIGPVTCP